MKQDQMRKEQEVRMLQRTKVRQEHAAKAAEKKFIEEIKKIENKPIESFLPKSITQKVLSPV